MGETKIEWTQKTWNPVTGCTKVSQGCKNCYAERMSKRLAGRCGYPADEPFRVTLHFDRLEEPLRWKKPTTIFVCSMGDLFHKDVPFEFIDQVFAVMALCQQHTFQVLTKRPERMLAYLTGHAAGGRHIWEAGQAIRMPNGRHKPAAGWPLPNVWLGTSCEDQEAADKRIHYLLQVPAVVRFLSCEPLLGPLNLRQYLGASGPMYKVGYYYGCIHQVITGAESGPGARPMDEEWVRSLRDQCIAGKVKFFYKQLVKGGKKISLPELDGKVWDQMPEITP